MRRYIDKFKDDKSKRVIAVSLSDSNIHKIWNITHLAPIIFICAWCSPIFEWYLSNLSPALLRMRVDLLFFQDQDKTRRFFFLLRNPIQIVFCWDFPSDTSRCGRGLLLLILVYKCYSGEWRVGWISKR